MFNWFAYYSFTWQMFSSWRWIHSDQIWHAFIFPTEHALIPVTKIHGRCEILVKSYPMNNMENLQCLSPSPWQPEKDNDWNTGSCNKFPLKSSKLKQLRKNSEQRKTNTKFLKTKIFSPSPTLLPNALLIGVSLADSRVWSFSCVQLPGHFPWASLGGSGTSRWPGHPIAITDVSAGGTGRQEAEWSRGDLWEPRGICPSPKATSTPAWSLPLPWPYMLLVSFPHQALSRGKALILRPGILNSKILTHLTVLACQPTQELNWRWIVT